MENHGFDRAEDCFHRAQKWVKDLPADDMRRGTLLLDLGEVEGLRHNFARAEELLQASIKIFDVNPRRSDPQKVIALEQLAIAEAVQKKPRDSLDHFDQAIALEQSVNGPNSPKLAKLLREYGGILLVNGRIDDATRAVRRATDVENDKGEKWLSTTSPSTEPTTR